MKKVYSAVLIANFLIESAGAFALFAAPEFLVDAGNASAVLWAWNYGRVRGAVPVPVRPEIEMVPGPGGLSFPGLW